ncbi:MAG: helix-turn-helix transcriptional regulator [Verrucomicrobiota bacterium]
MPRLTHSQYSRLLDFIADLQQPVDGANFGARLVSLVGELVPGSVVAVDQIHEPTGKYLLDHNCPLDPADTARLFGRLQQVYQQNPIYPYMQAGGKGPVVRLSDLCSRRTLERTDFFNDIFRPLDLHHQLSVMMPRAGWITTLTISRDQDLPQPTADLLLLASRHINLAHHASQLFGPLASPKEGIHLLTLREQDVFRWMREGKRNGEIAIILGCSVRTVEKHVENILHKTSSETRGAAVRKLDGD